MRGFPALHVRNAGLCHRVSAADLDAIHQIEALERDVLDRAEVDRRSVVDADVDTAELVDGLGRRRAHRVTVTDVADDRQRLATGLLDLLGRGVDGARKLGMGLSGLGDQSDVRAVGRDPLGDRQPDAAAGAGDKHGLSCECYRAAFRGGANTVVTPGEHNRLWVTSWTVFSPTMAPPIL